MSDYYENMVSDHAIDVLTKHGLVKKLADNSYKFIDRRLGYKCQCGGIHPHHYADGGLYITCKKTYTNWILYFGIDDLVNHLEKGSVIVLDKKKGAK